MITAQSGLAIRSWAVRMRWTEASAMKRLFASVNGTGNSRDERYVSSGASSTIASRTSSGIRFQTRPGCGRRSSRPASPKTRRRACRRRKGLRGTPSFYSMRFAGGREPSTRRMISGFFQAGHLMRRLRSPSPAVARTDGAITGAASDRWRITARPQACFLSAAGSQERGPPPLPSEPTPRPAAPRPPAPPAGAPYSPTAGARPPRGIPWTSCSGGSSRSPRAGAARRCSTGRAAPPARCAFAVSLGAMALARSLSSARGRFRVLRRMSRTTFSAAGFVVPAFRLIVWPPRARRTENPPLRNQLRSLIGADDGHRIHRSEVIRVASASFSLQS